jgi:hypothetical protein
VKIIQFTRKRGKRKMTFVTVEEDVIEILKNNEEAKADDMLLFALYVKKHMPEPYLQSYLHRVFTDNAFRISYGIAPYGTVSRIRRKLQEEYHELKAPANIILNKKELEKNYRSYAKKERLKHE